MEETHLGRIGVLMGGVSSEREISLRSGMAILNALQDAGCSAVAVTIDTQEAADVLSTLREAAIDVAFIALHGRFGEDGTLQGILEDAGIPYTGSAPQASRMAFNKILSQQIFEKNGLRVPAHVIADRNKDDAGELLKRIAFPAFVKPACEGSSIGVSYVPEAATFKAALDLAWRYGEQALVEQAIRGREFTVGILDREPLPVIEVRPKATYFDFTAKYQQGQSDYIVPAQIPEETAAKMQQAALEAFRLLGCRHMARVDLILDEKDTPYILEVNTIPGFTATSLLPKAARAAGINFDQLCLKITGMAYGKKKDLTRTTGHH